MEITRSCCLAIGILASGYAWSDGCQLKNYGTLPVEMIGPRATTMARINGADTRFMLDTGAFYSTMSAAAASGLKLDTRSTPSRFFIEGVGGTARAQIATVKDFGIVGQTLHDIEFLVGGSDVGYGLLGANLLDMADLEIDLAGGKMTLFKAEGCAKANLAYWVKDGGGYNVADLTPPDNPRYRTAYDPLDRKTYIEVTINGKKGRALLDTGFPLTTISRRAAEDAGIKLDGPGVKAAGLVSGIGPHAEKRWIAHVDSFSVGTETIQNTQMQIVDDVYGDGGSEDMVIGMDFLLSHRMFIGNSVGKAFFTYNGGRVFGLDKAPDGSDKADMDAAAGGADTTPRTAGDYALRGEAHLSRGEPKAALGDLNEAIRLAPDRAAYYLARARTQLALRQPDAALADLGQCLGLDPKNVDALMLRAEVRLQRKDHDGAAADAAAAGAVAQAGSAQARSLVDLYLHLGQPAAALPLLDDWIRLHDGDSELGSALNLRCWARSLSNQLLDGALKDCREAIRLGGENYGRLDSLGMVELRLGHYPESIKAYQQALALEPRSTWSHYGLGLAEIRSGQADAGKAELAAARALDPKIDEVAGQYGLAAGQ